MKPSRGDRWRQVSTYKYPLQLQREGQKKKDTKQLHKKGYRNLIQITIIVLRQPSLSPSAPKAIRTTQPMARQAQPTVCFRIYIVYFSFELLICS